MYNWRYFLILEDFNEENSSINRRRIRDASNPMELPDLYFQTKYRLTKEVFMYVLCEINLTEGLRSTYIPPILRLATTLEILAGGGYQWQTGGAHTAAMGHSTLSKIFRSTLSSMEETLCNQWISFEKKLPAVQRVVPQYGGAAHDSFVWKASNERKVIEPRYNNGDTSSWLLGDSGYPLEPWLMTPYRLRENKTDVGKCIFNDIHSKARIIVERGIGVYKGSCIKGKYTNINCIVHFRPLENIIGR